MRRVTGAIVMLLTLAVLLACFGVPSALAESDGMVRVKLTRLGSPAKIVMKLECDYYINGKAEYRLPSGTSLTITLSGGSLTLSSGSKAPTRAPALR